MKKINLLISVFLFSISIGYAQSSLTISTWNLEHLGSKGRGPARNLPLRTSDQITEIAKLINTEIKSDLLAVQEIALTHMEGEIKRNDKLDLLIKNLGPNWKYIIGSSNGEIQIGTAPLNMQNAFIWNASKVKLITAFELTLSDYGIEFSSGKTSTSIAKTIQVSASYLF